MKTFPLFLFLLISCGQLLGQANKVKYDKICYCSGRETPNSIISYDNNLQIILALKEGLSKNGLDSLNIPYTDSQLKLLANYNLIIRENNRYYTTIPVLDSCQSHRIRNQTTLIAERTLPLIEKDIIDFVASLKASFDTNNEFSILFSYVLDGLIWKEFEKEGVISPRDLDEETPFWAGQFWMIANPRKGKCGTNTSRQDNATIYITNGVPWRFMQPLYDEYDYLEVALKDISKNGKVTTPGIVDHFAKYDLFNEEGDILVPLIYEHYQNELYQLASNIATSLSICVLDSVTLPSLVKEYRFHDIEQALIVFYHEIMWDILTLIEKKGIIQRPGILMSAKGAELHNMADLIFFVVEN